jgi:hypothetical protein
MNKLRLVIHSCPEWQGAFRIHLASDGRLLGIGRDASKVAIERATEEGLAGDDTLITFDHDGFNPPRRERGRVGDLRKGGKPKAA